MACSGVRIPSRTRLRLPPCPSTKTKCDLKENKLLLPSPFHLLPCSHPTPSHTYIFLWEMWLLAAHDFFWSDPEIRTVDCIAQTTFHKENNKKSFQLGLFVLI